MKTVKMQLFGSFSLTDGDAVLGEETLRSGKLTRMLAYIIMNRDSVLTHQKLIEVFWEDNSRNPDGALKNLMYRLRTALKVLGKETYVCTLPGAYRWNPEIEVETDYEQFEQMTAGLRGMGPETEKEEKKKVCRDIIACYRGNVSGRISDESWILPKVTWYQSLYMDTIKVLCEIYEEERNWYDLEMICNQALGVDVLDEDIHCSLIRSLYGQRKYDLAMFRYEKANKLFYENMGIRHPEKLRSVFREMMAGTGEYTTDINSILEEAREPDKPEGVFFCDYQIFRQIYRMEARRIERMGVAEYVVLLTVRRDGRRRGESSLDQGLIEGLEILESVLKDSLRIGDVASRYSPTQFIILLPTCSYESGITVIERIQKSFYKNIGKRRLELLFELTELSIMG